MKTLHICLPPERYNEPYKIFFCYLISVAIDVDVVDIFDRKHGFRMNF